MQRVFWAERSTACRARRRGSQFLTFCTKIGSSGVVKFYQKSIFQRIQARQRLFFLVFYVAKPKFQKKGGEISGVAVGCTFLDFSRHGRFYKWKSCVFSFCSECGKIFRDFVSSLGKQEVGFCFLSFCRKIRSATNPNRRLLFLALIAVLDNSSLLGLVAPRRLFKLGGLAIMQEQSQEKYIIYVRKSTDVEDKQVLSVEAQIVELRKYAADDNLQYCRYGYREKIGKNTRAKQVQCHDVGHRERQG